LVCGKITFNLIITMAIDKKCQDQRSEVTAATTVVRRGSSQQHCHAEERKLPKVSACILNTADTFDLLPYHYLKGNVCNVSLLSLNWNILM